MEKTLVMSLENHNIYYFSDSKMAFYLAIPCKKFNSCKIAMELRNDTEELIFNNNNINVLVNKLNSIYSKLDNTNVSLAIPVISNTFLNNLNVNSNERMFEALDKALGSVINYSYLTLSEDNITVEKDIIMINNNNFVNFMNWFMNKYQNRCQYKSVMEIVGNSYDNLDKVEIDGINFVVGKEEVNNLENEVDNNNYKMKLDNDLILNEVDIDEDNIPIKKEAHQAGYISYYLLGVISIAVSLVVLYLLL